MKYRSCADAGLGVLLSWYNPDMGLWNNAGWWNSAAAVETIADYSLLTHSTRYNAILSNTFDKHKGNRFLNNFYDDEGWWALAWIKAYDSTGEARYLAMARTIFHDMQDGWDVSGGGGLWWSKDRHYKAAISNELFLAVAARLHRRTSAGPSSVYRDWAQREWSWFKASGMINEHHLVHDGLTSNDIWSYNQGVILGALVDLYAVTGDRSLLDTAQAIAGAAVTRLVNPHGILRELVEPGGINSTDQPQFKGIFVRNLATLYHVTHEEAYRSFILKNADSIWRNSRSLSNRFGARWDGPFDSGAPAKQSSALDALIAALSVEGEAGAGTQALACPERRVGCGLWALTWPGRIVTRRAELSSRNTRGALTS